LARKRLRLLPSNPKATVLHNPQAKGPGFEALFSGGFYFRAEVVLAVGKENNGLRNPAFYFPDAKAASGYFQEAV
jgi:hypothetical protein